MIDPNVPKIRAIVAFAGTEAAAITAALAGWPVETFPDVITLATSTGHGSAGPAAEVATVLVAANRTVIGIQPHSIGQSLRSLTRPDEHWVERAVQRSTGSTQHVRIPRWREDAAFFLGVVQAAPPTLAAARLPVAAFWSGFAHPRYSLLARIAPASGVGIEVSYALGPDATIIVARLDDGFAAILSDDLLAADLIWLALAHDPERRPDELGPWQHPAVQHAANLGLGLRGPAYLRLEFTSPMPGEARSERVRNALGLDSSEK